MVLERFGLDAKHAGEILALMALVMVFIQGGAIGKLVKKYGEVKLVMLGTIIMACALTAASISYQLPWFVAALMVQALGFAVTNPSLSSITSRNASADHQGSTMGVYQSAGSLARVLGPLLAGFLFDHFGSKVPFLNASGIFLLCFMLALSFGSKIKPALSSVASH